MNGSWARADEVDIVDGIVERARAHLRHPPRGDDHVIALASPEELLDAFARDVGIGLGGSLDPAPRDRLLSAVERIIAMSVRTSHPRFVNQNFAGADPVAVAGDWLGAVLNTTAATYEAAPVFTLMECAVLHRLGRMLGYVPGESDPVPAVPPGVFCAGGSMGTLLALQLARHRHQPDLPTRGANGDRLALFVSTSGHYSAKKSAALLGLGTEAVVEVESDGTGAMRPDALGDSIVRARAEGRVPFAVIATAGTTVTAAFDDLHAVADHCEREGLWLHVDACYGGSARFSPNHAHRLDGVERSDSCVWNLHKMMGMTQQCTALLVREPERLEACFSTRADYLFQPDKLHGDYDLGDRTVQCARRVDVLKLWLAWQVRGDAGFGARVDHAVALADHARRRIAGPGPFVPIVSGTFTNAVFAWVPPHLRSELPSAPGDLDPAVVPPPVRDALHRVAPAIKARLQEEGVAMISYQPVGGLNAFRMICMNPTMSAADVDAILDAIDRVGRDLFASS